MRVDRGRLNWGVFFIVLGAVSVAYHQGAVSSSALGEAWRLWPLILVGIGLGFVLSRTPAFFIGGTVVAVCLGLVFGSVLAVGPNIGCGYDGNNPHTVSQSGPSTARRAWNSICSAARLRSPRPATASGTWTRPTAAVRPLKSARARAHCM